MTKYKIHFISDVYETVEVDASSKEEAEDKFHKGEIDLSDAKEELKENLKIDSTEEV